MPEPSQSLSASRILKTWWPLAFSWLLMSVELPALSAVVARLPDPEIHLAAYGGIVFPVALIVESPIIMLLAASTALSKDWDSYRKIYRFMMRAGAILTALHLIIALTPLYFVVARGIIGVPEEIVGPARIGLILMTPWTWTIAYRRFKQGLMIRYDRSWAVGLGTVVRLLANGTVLAVGYTMGTLPGIVVATLAISAGVTSEAIFSGIAARPVVTGVLKEQPTLASPLTFAAFMSFYIPLALTSLINLLNQPIGSAAMSRMPLVVSSLAVWPVLNGLLFIFRSAGFAYQEVVVALMDQPRAIYAIRRVMWTLSVVVTGLMFLMAVTPGADFWLREVMALKPELADIAYVGVWLALPMPILSMIRNTYQGIIVHSGRTRGITEAVGIYVVSISLLLFIGVRLGTTIGLYVAIGSFSIAEILQVGWLWWRSREARRQARAVDSIITIPVSVPAQ